MAWIVNSMWSKTATSSPLSVDKHSFVEYFKSFPKGRGVLALKVTILWSQFEVLPTSKSKNEAFPPHHLLTMCAAIRASNLLEATSTPTFNTHNHNTRSVSNNNITTPACKRNSGLRTFHSSACRLWNALDPEPKTLSHTNFKNYLFKLYRSLISSLDHFKICKTF